MFKKIRIIAGLMAVLLLISNSFITASAASVYDREPNDSIAEAQSINFGDTVDGCISTYGDYDDDYNGDIDYYKLTLPSSGLITLKFTSYIEYYSLFLYDSDGNEIWDEVNNQYVSTVGRITNTHKVDLVKGTYYLKVEGTLCSYKGIPLDYYVGDYNFTTSFVSSGENIAEPNNSINGAKAINFGKRIIGQIAYNDGEDYYKLVLSKNDTVSIFFTSSMSWYSIFLYDVDGYEKTNAMNNELTSATGKRNDKYVYNLTKGIYYLRVNGTYYRESWDDYYADDYCTGNYNFLITTSQQFFNVYYHLDNGSAASKTTTKVTFDKATATKTLKQLGFKKKGYNFIGWRVYRTADKKWAAYKGNSKTLAWVSQKNGKLPSGYTYALYGNGASLSQTALSGQVHFYAQWKKAYTITYKLNGGKNSSGNPKTYTAAKAVTLKTPTRKGYTFKGWYSDKKLTKKVTKIKEGSTGNKTFYAKWKKATYQIDYYMFGGKNNKKNPKKYTVTTSTITLKKPTLKGYTFKGWYKNCWYDYGWQYSKKVTKIKKGSAGNITLYAKWELTNYKINYKLNGGESNYYNPNTYTIESSFYLCDPYRTGYTFKGWYSDKKLTKKVTKIKEGSTGSKTFYAKWKKDTYTITYVLSGGDNNSKNPRKYTVTTPTIKLKKPTLKGYTFRGWYFDRYYNNEVSEIPKGSAGDLTLYARWENNDYKIIMDVKK